MTTIEKVALAAARSTYAETSLLNPAFAYVPSNKTGEAGVLARWRAKIEREKSLKARG